MRTVRRRITPLLIIIFLFIFFLPLISKAFGAWEFDAEVTEVGRGAERARELLYWVMTHPTDYTNPGIRILWQGVRNSVYLFFILVIVMVGVTTMVFRGQWISIGVGLVTWGEEKLGKWIPRLVGLIIFATFSYLITVALANLADLLMGFFIRHYGGCDLFNIKFGGPGSSCDFSLDALKAMEENYQFIGYRETTVTNNEAAGTALLLVRITTFTYNFLSIVFILRQVILWLLITVSPIIALLFPFVLVRNVGWIWIGEFLRWLFYGPLVAIFLAGLVQVWKIGIPYGFDFSRTRPPAPAQPAIVFPTAISILIGGPAQGARPYDPTTGLGSLNSSAPISGTNSLNYVDTYAEYLISLIMLWMVILLPFLLLRIFRDYCCEVFGARQETLWALYDKIKSWGQPPGPGEPPAGPTETPKRTGPTGQLTMDLPYRQLKALPQALTRQQVEQIAQAKTEDIVRQLGLAVPSMREIALADMNLQRRGMMQQSLQALANPASIAAEDQRERYSQIHNELFKRAKTGDLEAQRLLAAARGQTTPETFSRLRSQEATRTALAASQRHLNDAQKLARVEKQIREKNLPIKIPTSSKMSATEKLESVQKEAAAKNIALTVPARILGAPGQAPAQARVARPPGIPITGKPVKVPSVDLEEYEEIKQMWLNHYRLSEVPVSEKIASRQKWLEHDVKAIQNAIDKISSVVPEIKKQGFDEVAAILPFLLLGGFSENQTLVYLKAKLAAAKQVLEEMITEEEIKKQAKKEVVGEEEELVEVPAETEAETKKAAEAVRALAQELPADQEEKPTPPETPDQAGANQKETENLIEKQGSQ